jgi:hypothetical protein
VARNPADTLAQQIAALEAALQLPLPEEARQHLLANLKALQAAAAPTGDVVAGDKVVDPQGTVNVSGIAHIAVGVNLGTIIYGHIPTDEQREQLTRYLRRLAAKLQRLPCAALLLASMRDKG